MAKPGCVFDAEMLRKSDQNAREALGRGCKKKSFSLKINGTFYGTKMGDVVNGSIKAVKKTILALRDTDKKLHSVTLKFYVHDTSVVFNFGAASTQYEKIITAIREYVGKDVSVNHGLVHKQSTDMCLCIEGEMIEKELHE